MAFHGTSDLPVAGSPARIKIVDTKILIVDDSPYIVDGLVALLKRKDYTPVAAYSGGEALTILGTTKPDLILLDIMRRLRRKKHRNIV